MLSTASAWPALALLALISLTSFLLTAWATRRASTRARAAFLGAVVAALVFYVAVLYDQLTLARLLPVADVLIVGNVIPVLAAAIMGLLVPLASIPLARKVPLLILLAVATGRVVGAPWVGPRPLCGDRWEKGVCRQTTGASCGAAAAATLLACHGIPASEAELADLCLTHNGTPRLGLYRGLKLKTHGTPWRVEVFQGDVAKLRTVTADRPAILFVGLRRGQHADARYARDWGWTPGLRHVVVLFGFESGGFIDVGDPMAGRERWRAEALDVLWDGQALMLTQR